LFLWALEHWEDGARHLVACGVDPNGKVDLERAMLVCLMEKIHQARQPLGLLPALRLLLDLGMDANAPVMVRASVDSILGRPLLIRSPTRGLHPVHPLVLALVFTPPFALDLVRAGARTKTASPLDGKMAACLGEHLQRGTARFPGTTLGLALLALCEAEEESRVLQEVLPGGGQRVVTRRL
jgi:hypothetical protein